jgi:hypothetical protein
MEHELQANKLHIQALMQQLHAIAAKQALGGSEAADNTTATTETQEAGPTAACTDQQHFSSSAHTAAEDAPSGGAAAASSPAGSGGSCCSSSGGSAVTPVRSFNCQGVSSPPSSSEATSRCRPAGSSFAPGACMPHSKDDTVCILSHDSSSKAFVQ